MYSKWTMAKRSYMQLGDQSHILLLIKKIHLLFLFFWALFLASISKCYFLSKHKIELRATQSSLLHKGSNNTFLFLSHGFLKIALKLYFINIQYLLYKASDMLCKDLDNLNFIYSKPFHCTSTFTSELLNTKLNKPVSFW